MDPVTAIGLASGILSFITFSSKLISGAIKIHDAVDGHLAENRSRQLVIQEMKKFNARLLAPNDSTLVGQDKGLCALATECQTLASDLIALLERIKPKNHKSKAQSLWSALKNVIHEKEKIDLEQRLDRCRSQLELQITFLTSQETRASLEGLLSLAKTDNRTLLRLQGNIEQLGRGIEVSSISESAQLQLRELIGVQESVLHAIARQRILKAISFDGMNGRYNMVEDPYLKTFRWIFGDAYPDKTQDGDLEGLNPGDDELLSETTSGIRPDHDDVETDENSVEMKRLAREKFMGWLTSQDGIFHISGKLGSGKSTLMRFLYQHQCTKAALEKWAGNRAVVLAGFFFWSPGSDLQKSLAGLFRSILYRILEQCPEFIPIILPEQWAGASIAPLQAQFDVTISEKEIQNAFYDLIHSKSLYRRRCFCIFIDGLDEFQATPQVDRKDLVNLLHSWADTSPAVKLCVSSREDNVFMNAFAPERRFRLHELTKHDMRSYVTDKLGHLPGGKSKDELIGAIPERAQGIFLWVSVVSKSIREEFENGKSVESLWRMLESLPDELHDLFEHMLRSLGRTVRKRAYQTLKMLLLSKEIGIAFHALGYSFFEEYESDPNFAFTDDFKCRAAAVRGDPGFMIKRTERGQRQLSGWCRGLLEVIPGRPGEPAVIDYTHRSVAEFLRDENTRADIGRYTEGFDCTNAVSQLVLATQSHIDDPQGPRSPAELRWRRSRLVCPHILEYRHSMGLDSAPPFTFLESLASLPCLYRPRPVVLYTPEGSDIVRDHAKAQLGTVMVQRLGKTNDPKFDMVLRVVEHPFTTAARLRNHDYITWKLQRDPVLLRDPYVMALVTFALLGTDSLATGTPEKPHRAPGLDWSLVGSLLHQGFLNPNFLTPLQPYPFHYPRYFEIQAGFRTQPFPGYGDVERYRDTDFNVSVWEHLLVEFFLSWLIPSSGTKTPDLGTMLRVFLEHGAGGSAFCIYVEVMKTETGFVKDVYVEFEAQAEGEKKLASIRYFNRDMGTLLRNGYTPNSFRDVEGWDLVGVARCKRFTLRSWVEYCTYEELPNKDHILGLLDRPSWKLIRDIPANSGELDPPSISGDSDNQSDGPLGSPSDNGGGANSRQRGTNENGTVLTTQNSKQGDSSFPVGNQVKANHTPSSVFGMSSASNTCHCGAGLPAWAGN